eukprot:TRINITY_DN49553_c0_g1_i1.p1 TRINITY_DN49553_c0_g1~~TRINITY_DN49553_c0_g1_i1.p1  ORF type:complete len:433 (+),score=73.16 TRINITY_DN49553_c0_g1_i1:174-1472(+)
MEVITAAGSLDRCQAFLDVRYEDGSASTGNVLDFRHGDRPQFKLTQPTAYLVVRQQQAGCEHLAQIVFAPVDGPVTNLLPDPPRLHPITSLGPEMLPRATVTIFTQLDASRLPRLERLAASVDLPVSAAVLCENAAAQQRATELYHGWVKDRKALNVQIHLATVDPTRTDQGGWEQHRYPVQALRNLALRRSKTKWVVYAEADMVFGGGNVAAALEQEAQALEQQPRVVSVVPVYQLADESAGTTGLHFPGKERLRDLGFKPCSYHSHKFMDYKEWEQDRSGSRAKLLRSSRPWLQAAEGDPGKECVDFEDGVSGCSKAKMEENWTMEPYFLASKDELPDYDELVEFGTWDKLEQIKLIAMCGWRFAVNPLVYLFNAPHNQEGILVELALKPASGRGVDPQVYQDRQAYYQWYHHILWTKTPNVCLRRNNTG